MGSDQTTGPFRTLLGVVFLLAADDLIAQRPIDSLPQQALVIVPGARLRITALESGNSRRHSGTVVAATPDTVTLRLDRGGETVSFPLAQATFVELGQGRTGNRADGGAIGFLVGAGIGALFGVVTGLRADNEHVMNRNLLVGGGAGGVVGILVGGAISAGRKTENWEPVPSSRWSVGGGPGRGGFVLTLSKRF